MEFELIGEQIEAVKTAFPAHSDSIETISAKPNGREIATGSHDHTIKLWDVETMKSTQTLSEHRLLPSYLGKEYGLLIIPLMGLSYSVDLLMAPFFYGTRSRRNQSGLTKGQTRKVEIG